MSSDSEDELNGLLAYSGSEYEPSCSSGDSNLGQSSDASLGSNSGDNTDSDGNSKKRKKVRKHDRKRKRLSRNNRKKNNGNVNPNGITARVSSLPVSYKYFKQFFQGITFSMSGFVNPLRSDLRIKAIEMGARYKPDWDGTCTHLICAFQNTPKYSQVRGIGKIVKKEWIEDSYRQRKRFPWRRYALDQRDASQSESEGEIHETNAANTRTDDSNQSQDDSLSGAPGPSTPD